jgi:transglutaminase-like putative cysteine protease
MIFDISHRTHYRYGAPVSQSQHVLHLAPRPVPHQIVHRHSLMLEPAPSARHDRIDYFGNPVSLLTIEVDHRESVLHARSTIEVNGVASVDLANTIAWETLGDLLDVRDASIPLDVHQFASRSRHTAPTLSIRDYVAPSFPAGRPVLEGAWDLTRRMFADFAFDSTATDVATPVSTVLEQRRGVCQDFAHLALAALRALGLPARYVSGYILTRPPPGQPKLQGSDASHAWISVWAPESGWVDFDPTNGVIPAGEHITIAWGRDFDDVSPVSGVLLGGGHHSVSVAVDVEPADAPPSAQ